MKRFLAPKFLIFVLTLFIASLHSAHAIVSDSQQTEDFPSGQRVQVCGVLSLIDGNLFVLSSPHDEPIRVIGTIPRQDEIQATQSEKDLGACFAGHQLPQRTADGMLEFKSSRFRVSDLIPVLLHDELPPFKICGSAVNDVNEVYIQYGPGEAQRVYLLLSNERASFRNPERLSSPWCAFTEALPNLRQNGKWEITPSYLRSDWERSGFSVGNL